MKTDQGKEIIAKIEESPKSQAPETRQKWGKTEITDSQLEKLANSIEIDETKLPTFQTLTLPLVNTDLNEVGRAVIRGIYEPMVRRTTTENKSQLYDRKVQFANKFIERVKDHQMPIVRERQPGQTAFHFANKSRIHDIHAYYFDKTSKEWKHPNEDQARAYITVDPQKISEIGTYFADLCAVLHRSGIDFRAKSADPYGASDRTDNMVFYISKSDEQAAVKLIRTFLRGRRIAKGQVLSAIPDDEIDGLSWAYEPSEEGHRLWRNMTGDKENASFSSLLALKVAPRFFRRLAEAHSRLGNLEDASKFLQLASAISHDNSFQA